MSEPSTRIRLNVISEVALEGGEARPIHMFRPGTFTDMNGRETSFTDADVATIVQRFAAHPRRKPPITERHDFGRAIGRLLKVWSDAAGNLYGLPKWNNDGKTLLENEVYDGFSCELDREDDGWTLIGGSLTNYPAVGGLEPVTLAAPPLTEAPTMPPAQAVEDTSFLSPISSQEIIRQMVEANHAYMAQQLMADAPTQSWDTPATSTPLANILAARASLSAPSAPVPTRDDTTTPIQPSQGVTPMSEPMEPAVMAAPTLPPISDPSVQARLDAYLAQTQAQMAQREREIEQRLTADFERRMLETEQRNAIHAFARRATVTTPDQPYAIPGTAEELANLLLSTPSAVRSQWSALLTRITTAGLVSFDEIGSSGEAGEAADRWSILVNAKVATGMSRVDAIKAVSKEHPDLYAAQSHAKKGVR